MENTIHKPYNKFKGAIREKGITYADIARLLGVSTTCVSHKVNGRSDFYITQIEKMQNAYGLELKIFLP
jgi:cyanate lyase